MFSRPVVKNDKSPGEATENPAVQNDAGVFLCFRPPRRLITVNANAAFFLPSVRTVAPVVGGTGCSLSSEPLNVWLHFLLK